jgi:hypothetical protein
MKQSYSNVAFFAIIACVAYIAVAAAMPPPPPPPSPTVSNTESGGGDVESRSCNESEMPLAAASDLVSVRKGIDGF